MTVKNFVLNPLRVNTYIIHDETKQAAIIDCGAYSKTEKQLIENYIREEELVLKCALNTHLHFDHILGNNFILERYGLKPQYAKEDEDMPGLATGSMFPAIPVVHIKTDNYLENGDEIQVGNMILKIIHTPGHSPGSLSFYNKHGNCVFSGDTLFRRSIGRTDLWEGDLNTLLKVIRTKLFSLPDNTIIYPGHEEISTIIEEKCENPYVRIT
ncbi:MAG: MBL fold metallo-hydrolase [Dysgonamonadaceae bacterium]|jgi:glyoxylase-like metal-dependent hydrolase (beta-lactamase superfamily II)|nr:MBL fold metallo-hydrolase [Dysgonamonadaceae bacterium]